MPARSILNSGRFIRKLMLVLGGILTLLMVLIFIVYQAELSVKFFTSWYSILASMLLFMIMLVFLRSHYKKPENLTFALFGLPQSGKTVYLQTLMYLMNEYRAHKISVNHPDENTNRSVMKSIQILSSGQWLPRSTEPRDVFRLSVTLGSQLFPERLRVHFVDHNLKRPKEQHVLNAQAVARTGAYRALTQSDAIIFVLDAQSIVGGDITANVALHDIYKTAIQEVQKAHRGEMPIKMPAALIFTKIDYIEHIMQPTALTSLIQELINLCKKTFVDFRIFYVSSVGKVTELNIPANPLKPRQVIEPFIWLVNKFD